MSPYEQPTIEEVAEWPGASVSFEMGGKHGRAVLVFGGQSRFAVMALSPSDSRSGLANHIAQVRRELAAMGATRTEREAAEPKEYRPGNNGRASRVVDVGEPAPVIAEPWEPLEPLANAPLITAIGAYPGVSNEDYHRNPNLCWGPSISSSGLKTLLGKSPRHYWWDSPLNPDRPDEEDKAHLNVGKAAHDLLLLSERWPECYFVLPAKFNPNATTAQAEWHAERAEAEKAGKTILKASDAEIVKAMAAALRENAFAAAALTNGISEMTLVWTDPETGVILRARPDFLPTKRIIIPDLKTAADGSPLGFMRAIGRHGYAQSAALYLDGIAAIYGDQPKHWLHVVLEKEPPYVVSLYELPGEDIARGRYLNRRAIRKFADCLSQDRWPGYSDEPTLLGMPSWDRRVIDEGITPEGEAWSEAA